MIFKIIKQMALYYLSNADSYFFTAIFTQTARYSSSLYQLCVWFSQVWRGIGLERHGTMS